jgi:hypothetical protein
VVRPAAVIASAGLAHRGFRPQRQPNWGRPAGGATTGRTVEYDAAVVVVGQPAPATNTGPRSSNAAAVAPRAGKPVVHDDGLK